MNSLKRAMIGALCLTVVTVASSWASGQKEPSAQQTVSYWGFIPYGSVLPQMIADTQQKYPNLKVDAQIMDWGPYWDKLTVSMATGEGPDTFAIDPAYYPKFVDDMEPLDALAAQVIGPDWKDQFKAPILKEAYMGQDSLKALPEGYGGQWYIFYNKTLLDKYGLPVPKTYHDLVQIASFVKEKGLDILPVAFGAKEQDNALYFYYSLVQNENPGIVQKAAAGQASWTDPAFVKGAEDFQHMVSDGVIPKSSFGMMPYPDANEAFLSEKAFTTISGFWQANAYMTVGGSQLKGTAAQNDQIGATVLPNIHGGTSWVLASIDHSFAINKSSKNKIQAMELISQWTLGKASQDWLSLLLAEPAAKNVTLAPNFLSEEAKDTFGVFHASYANVAGQRGSGSQTVDEKFGQVLQAFMLGTTSVEDGLRQVQSYYEANK